MLRCLVILFVCLHATSATANGVLPVRGADELFWVPTLEQASEMAKATGRQIFLMGYSLVDGRSTYTKISPEYCSSVF